MQKPGAEFWSPVYSPTGHVLFQQVGEVQGIWAFSFSLERMERTAEPFRVIEAGSLPTVANDGTLLLAADSDPLFAPRQLVWVDRTGKVLGTVGPVLPALTQPRLSPDERRVVAVSGESMNRIELWMIDVDGGGALPITHKQTPGFLPHWAPDGRSVYCSHPYDLSETTWKISADGTGAEQKQFEGAGFPSPGGNYILVKLDSTKNPNSQRWIYFQPPNTNALPVPLSEVFNAINSPAFNPDDRRLAFSASISGRPEVWAAAFPSLSNRVMVSREGGQKPVWHRNGRELFYLSRNGRSMMSAHLGSDQNRFDPPVKLFDLPDSIFTAQTAGYDVTADGQRFLMPQKAADSADRGLRPNVVLMENWLEEHRSR